MLSVNTMTTTDFSIFYF